jgi:hypothetical protein
MKREGPPRLFGGLPPLQRGFALLVTAAIGLIALGGIALMVPLVAWGHR